MGEVLLGKRLPRGGVGEKVGHPVREALGIVAGHHVAGLEGTDEVAAAAWMHRRASRGMDPLSLDRHAESVGATSQQGS